MKSKRKRRIPERLPGSSMVYAIMVALVVSILASVLIVSGMYQRYELHAYLTAHRVKDNAASGLNLLLSDALLPDGYQEDIALWGEGNDSVALQKCSWGLFNVLVSEAHSGRYRHRQMALSGPSMGSPERSACLYLSASSGGISVTGETELRGLLYLQNQRIQPLSLSGMSFSGTPVAEHRLRSLPGTGGLNSLPGLPVSLEEIIPGEFEKGSLSLLASATLYHHSFAGPPLLIQGSGHTLLRQTLLSGQVIIMAGQKLEVFAGAWLEDVILLAPTIILHEGVGGNFQAYASDSLVVKNGVKLGYPSVLGLLPGNSQQPSLLVLGEQVDIRGMIYGAPLRQGSPAPVFRMAPSARLMGQVYWPGQVQAAGRIKGLLAAGSLGTSLGSTYYDGLLVNTRLENWDLPVPALGLPVISDTRYSQCILKWVN